MSRDLDAAIVTEILKPAVQVGLFVDLDFASGHLRLWSGMGNIDLGGNTFTGVGTLGQISPIEEGTDVSAKNLSLTLSGIPSEMLALALTESYQGRNASLNLCFFDAAWTLLYTIQLFGGRMDTMVIDEGPETSTITVTCENRLADLKRARIWRYTHADQQALYPGDMGLQFVAGLQEVEIAWGPGSGMPRTYPQVMG